MFLPLQSFICSSCHPAHPSQVSYNPEYDPKGRRGGWRETKWVKEKEKKERKENMVDYSSIQTYVICRMHPLVYLVFTKLYSSS